MYWEINTPELEDVNMQQNLLIIIVMFFLLVITLSAIKNKSLYITVQQFVC